MPDAFDAAVDEAVNSRTANPPTCPSRTAPGAY